MSRSCRAVCLTLLCLLGLGELLRADDAPANAAPAVASETKPKAPARKYVRIERDDNDELVALQTAIVHFAPVDASKGELIVDLVGAIHVGEKGYYEELNRQFDGYDAVLYELVAPEGAKIPKGTKPGSHPVAMLQNGMKDMLALEHQLQLIDYTKQNMVHADMSPDDFAKSMADRNESFFTMFFRMMGQAMAQQSLQTGKSKTNDFEMLAALFDRNRSLALKRIMAEQFENMDGMMGALEGPEGSTIITERNKVALKVLNEQIAAGKKRIAVFYGAGHLNDIEKRLVSEFGLKRTGENWVTAWNLKPAAKTAKPAAAPAKKAA